jgi:uncharacterized protein YkwD
LRSTSIPLLLVAAITACGGDGDGTLGEVSSTSFCAPVSSFDAAIVADEDEVLRLVNQHRAAGADCGEAGVYEPTHPLVMDSRLRCAARVHSLDMAERDYFSHYSPEGDGPSERISATGYQSRGWGENIARRGSAEEAVGGWMNSSGHCANIMRDSYDHIGIGRVDNLWTQVFARPR